jgi:uncharacterized protein (DUF486 family)
MPSVPRNRAVQSPPWNRPNAWASMLARTPAPAHFTRRGLEGALVARRRIEYGFAMKTVLLLVGSNLFMTYAWYGHLRTLRSAPWYVAVLASWAVAFFEYALQVPANRIGYGRFSLGQLKIMEEVIALAVFVPFSIVYMKEAPKLDYLWAALCIVAAAYFIFRSR